MSLFKRALWICTICDKHLLFTSFPKDRRASYTSRINHLINIHKIEPPEYSDVDSLFVWKEGLRATIGEIEE